MKTPVLWPTLRFLHSTDAEACLAARRTCRSSRMQAAILGSHQIHSLNILSNHNPSLQLVRHTTTELTLRRFPLLLGWRYNPGFFSALGPSSWHSGFSAPSYAVFPIRCFGQGGPNPLTPETTAIPRESFWLVWLFSELAKFEKQVREAGFEPTALRLPSATHSNYTTPPRPGILL